MTAGATDPVVKSERENGGEYDDAGRWPARPVCVITADGAYGARLARDGESWYPERWTLDGPEPYAVPLPGPQPEEPGAEVQPLTDGRVLIHRVADRRHAFSLLYPTGPGTGELPLGAVECPDAGTRLRLLPPAPDGERAYALAVGRGSTAVWLVAGGVFGPEHLAEVPGHCSGGVWLDGTGRLLALDRFQDGRTKTVVVDLERGGEVSPLLQIAEDSNDRLLLADADSGLLLIRSDAPSPGRERLGWGVLGSTLPVRFPDCLTATGCSITPFAIQPGRMLTPETCAVALRVDGPGGTWVGVWRPSERRIHHHPAPEGWLPGTGLWTAEGVLQLPYATGVVPCGVVRLEAPHGAGEPDLGDPAPPRRPASRPVPLQEAPLKSRLTASPAPVGGPPRTPSVHLALRTNTAGAPDTGTIPDAGHGDARHQGPPPVTHPGAAPVPRGTAQLPPVTSLTARMPSGEARPADTSPGGEASAPLPPVVRISPEPPAPLPAPAAVAGLRPGTGEPHPARPDPWTKIAEAPPPGLNLDTMGGRSLLAGEGLGAGDGNVEAPHAYGEFRGEVALRPAVSGPGFGFGTAPALPAGPWTPEEHRTPAEHRTPVDHPEDSGPRTAPPSRRPLHAGPFQPAVPTTADEGAPPAADPGAAVAADVVGAGGEGEETSPSETRTMTAR
jgi:hypothetical protein